VSHEVASEPGLVPEASEETRRIGAESYRNSSDCELRAPNQAGEQAPRVVSDCSVSVKVLDSSVMRARSAVTSTPVRVTP
jgi:hypothetical protein